MTPDIRIFAENKQPTRPERDFVLYWMIANRRLEWNFSLQRAIEEANRLRKPLVVLEALRCDYPWASDRLHCFVLQGMCDNQKMAHQHGLCYYPYVEPHKAAGKGLLRALSQRACTIITDAFPCFFLPRMVRAAAQKIDVRVESVDSNGIYPLADAQRNFSTAASFRRHLQKRILPSFAAFPLASPIETLHHRTVDLAAIQSRWPVASPARILDGGLAQLPIDHTVPPTAKIGGRDEAHRIMHHFLQNQLDRYHTDRNAITDGSASGLSPYFHFGHLSTHELVSHIVHKENWTPDRVAAKPNGSRQGWWGMSAGSEALLDQVITWRELGFVFCHQHPQTHDKLSSLPDWAQKTIAEHKDDPRPTTYTLEQLAAAQTHDPLWNSAQRQLLQEGTIHNYLRMLWGKKIYEWSPNAQQAIHNLIELNNRYALDGRNPNSYSGLFWVLGRFDRAWGPERPIFGKLRYMTSASTQRKLKTAQYQRKYSAAPSYPLFSDALFSE